jgi:hypothetical protein
MKLILASCFVAASISFAGDLGFSHMQNGDRIEVTEHSTGCFHNTICYYEVSRSDDIYSFRKYAITWANTFPRTILGKKALGNIILTKKDVAGLDGLLKFYRGKKEAASTTETSLLVEYYEPAGRVKIEKLYDGSGGHGLDNRDDVTTFFTLVQRFNAKGIEPGDPAAPAKPGR